MKFELAVASEADLVLVRGTMWRFLRSCGVPSSGATRVATVTSELCRQRLADGPCEVVAALQDREVRLRVDAPGWSPPWDRYGELLHGVAVEGPALVVPARSPEGTVESLTASMELQMSHRHSERARARAEEINARLEHANQELEAQGRVLRRVNRDLEMISAAVAHDLRQPLHALGMYGAIVERTSDPKIGGEVRAAVHRMNEMLNGLMRLAKIGEAERESSTELSSVLKETLKDLEHQVEESGAHIRLQGDATLRIGRNHLRVVLQNLVANAIKYSREDVPPDVRIDVAQQDEQVRLTFSDNGRGFGSGSSAATQLFHRLERDREVDGAGVGLALVQRVVRGYRGTLHIGDRSDAPGAKIDVLLDGRAHPGVARSTWQPGRAEARQTR